jgi:BirA family biotin operon repressor/biotin-[acetyl-CoA-carboxylase] ligase
METSLQNALSNTRVSQVRYFETIGSTNDEALRWIATGAPDFSLIVADEQTKGRGRFDRRWVTRPGSSLAFTLILTRANPDPLRIPLYAPLGGIAVQEAVQTRLGVHAQIKWPNDVLIDGSKFCGILVEAAWHGSDLQGVVIGIGINISPGSVPGAEFQSFPATCLETACGHPVDRLGLMSAILIAIDKWQTMLGTSTFMQRWQERLAFKGEYVRIEHSEKPSIIGKVNGVDDSGRLILVEDDGTETRIEIGDVHLRPATYNNAGGNHAG